MCLYFCGFAFHRQLASWGELIGTSSIIMGALMSVKYQSCITITWTLICVGTQESFVRTSGCYAADGEGNDFQCAAGSCYTGAKVLNCK